MIIEHSQVKTTKKKHKTSYEGFFIIEETTKEEVWKSDGSESADSKTRIGIQHPDGQIAWGTKSVQAAKQMLDLFANSIPFSSDSDNDSPEHDRETFDTLITTTPSDLGF